MPDGSPHKPASVSGRVTETRRARGLSQRLSQPLSLESAAQDAPVAVPEPLAPLPGSAESAAAAAETRPMSRLPQAAPEGLLRESTQLQNRYKILGVQGVGGMGAVYKAQDLRFSGVMRICAIKEMINSASDSQVRQMVVHNFEREASMLATLSHPAIPQVYDYFTLESRSYLVLEFITGQDLEMKLAETDVLFSESDIVQWALELCDVLSYLHSHKPRPIIFRDLKPSNIMLDEHNRIRLVDFGIAKLFQVGEKGTMIGTEGYSPPEQYRGIAEPRGDVYALGATLHHLLTRRDPRLEPPFSFKERPIPKANPNVSRELVSAIERALEYDINARWNSVDEFRRALLNLSAVRQGSTAQGTGSRGAGTGVVKPVWKFACEDEVRGSVTTHGGCVYIPCYDHNVYALEAESGKFVWKFPAQGGIASTPWVSDNLVVFGSTDATVYGVASTTGRQVWAVSTRGRVYASAFGEFAHVFIGSDDRRLYAIHQPSGRISWSYATEGEVRSRPLVDNGLIYFTCQMGLVYALGLNRELRWRFRARRGFLASPVLYQGLIFAGSLDWSMYALDVRSGWAAWRHRTGGPIVSTAAVTEGLVVFGSSDGCIYALGISDGRQVWRYEVQGQVTGSPLAYEGAIYIGGVDGSLYCLDAETGVLRWRFQTQGAITGVPAVADGLLFVGSADHYVYAIPA